MFRMVLNRKDNHFIWFVNMSVSACVLDTGLKFVRMT